MQQITIKDEFIKLGQALKLAGMVDSGVDAKIEIEEGNVWVNGAVETRRGKKLRNGDIFSFEGQECSILAPKDDVDEA